MNAVRNGNAQLSIWALTEDASSVIVQAMRANNHFGSIIPLLSAPLYFAISAIGAQEARAAFSQLTCPQGVWSQYVDFKIDGNQFDHDVTYTPYYSDSQLTNWMPIVTNSNVEGIWPTLGIFGLQSPDHFQFYDAVGASTQYIGVLNPWDSPLVLAPAALFPLPGGSFNYVFYMFATDSANNWWPPQITGSYVACGASQTTTATNTSNYLGATTSNEEILLIGTGDTVYAYFDQPATSKGTVLLTHRWPGHGDADLYISATNDRPDDSSFWARSWKQGDDEIALPYTSSTKRWYVGVHSYSGSAHVLLDVQFQKASNNIPLKVYVEINPTQTEKDEINLFLWNTTARVLSATDGGLLLGPYDVYVRPGTQCDFDTSCDICIDPWENFHADARILHHCKGAPVHVSRPIWEFPETEDLISLHEFGHACFGLAEEYSPGPHPLCGHSEMNSSNSTAGFCSRQHCLDGEIYDPNYCNAAVQSNWSYLKSQNDQPLTWARDWAGGGVDAWRTDYTNNGALRDHTSITWH